MLTEIRKSIKSILYERTTSPLWGTLIISWCLWNWRILYLTVFVHQNKIEGTKIDFIISNYSDPNRLFTFPLISTFLLLTVIPFAANGAYWLSIKFRKWRVEQKNEIEKKTTFDS